MRRVFFVGVLLLALAGQLPAQSGARFIFVPPRNVPVGMPPVNPDYNNGQRRISGSVEYYGGSGCGGGVSLPNYFALLMPMARFPAKPSPGLSQPQWFIQDSGFYGLDFQYAFRPAEKDPLVNSAAVDFFIAEIEFELALPHKSTAVELLAHKSAAPEDAEIARRILYGDTRAESELYSKLYGAALDKLKATLILGSEDESIESVATSIFNEAFSFDLLRDLRNGKYDSDRMSLENYFVKLKLQSRTIKYYQRREKRREHFSSFSSLQSEESGNPVEYLDQDAQNKIDGDVLINDMIRHLTDKIFESNSRKKGVQDVEQFTAILEILWYEQPSNKVQAISNKLNMTEEQAKRRLEKLRELLNDYKDDPLYGVIFFQEENSLFAPHFYYSLAA